MSMDFWQKSCSFRISHRKRANWFKMSPNIVAGRRPWDQNRLVIPGLYPPDRTNLPTISEGCRNLPKMCQNLTKCATTWQNVPKPAKTWHFGCRSCSGCRFLHIQDRALAAGFCTIFFQHKNVLMCVILVARYIWLKHFQNISLQYFSRQVPPQLSRASAREDLFIFIISWKWLHIF